MTYKSKPVTEEERVEILIQEISRLQAESDEWKEKYFELKDSSNKELYTIKAGNIKCEEQLKQARQEKEKAKKTIAEIDVTYRDLLTQVEKFGFQKRRIWCFFHKIR